MDLGLRGKVALITGGSEGIGRAAAQSLLEEGAKVVICARRKEVLDQAAGELRQATRGEVVAFAADVSTAEGPPRAVQAAIDAFGRLDILVNNAGTSNAKPFETVSDEVWEQDLQLKLFAAIRGSRAAIPHLRKAGGGSIVNLLNMAAKAPPAASVPTSVSRAAGMALMKALSKDLGPDNIRVNAILIGLVKAAQHDRKFDPAKHGSRDEFYAKMAKERGTPLGRVAEAKEAGDLIAFLCSARAAFISGAAINFDGGGSPVV